MSDDPTSAIPGSGRAATAQASWERGVMDSLLELYPPGTVLVLMSYFPDGAQGVSLKPGGRTNYISNGSRDDMAAAMIEMLKRWEKLP